MIFRGNNMNDKDNPDATEEAFNLGKEIALNALAEFDKKIKNHAPNKVFAGILTTLITAMYFVAPTEESAEEVIAFSAKAGLEDFYKENKN